MEETKQKIVNELKRFGKRLTIPVLIFVIILIILVSGVYVIQKDDFEEVTETTSNYTSSVDQNGNITYEKVDSESSSTRKHRK